VGGLGPVLSKLLPPINPAKNQSQTGRKLSGLLKKASSGGNDTRSQSDRKRDHGTPASWWMGGGFWAPKSFSDQPPPPRGERRLLCNLLPGEKESLNRVEKDFSRSFLVKKKPEKTQVAVWKFLGTDGEIRTDHSRHRQRGNREPKKSVRRHSPGGAVQNHIDVPSGARQDRRLIGDIREGPEGVLVRDRPDSR